MAEPSADHVIDTLNACLPKLAFSMSRYIAEEAYPYLEDGDKEAMGAVAEAAAAERNHERALSALIERLEGIPQSGAPNPLLANLNYGSFPWLLDELIRDKTAEIDACRKRLPTLEDAPEAHALLQGILADHEAHLKKFADVRARRYSPQTAPQA